MNNDEYTIVLDGHFVTTDTKELGDRLDELKEFLPKDDDMAAFAARRADGAAQPDADAQDGDDAGNGAAPAAKIEVEEKELPKPGTPEYDAMLKRAKARHDAGLRERREAMDRLYYEYESMRMMEPGIVSRDEVYPRSYYWRLGDRYDPGKIEVIKEALRLNVKIENTEAYERYVEEVRARKYAPPSWD